MQTSISGLAINATHRVKRLALTSIAVAVLAACGSDSEVGQTDPIYSGGQPPAPTTNSCPAVGNLIATDLGNDICEIGGRLLQDATLSADKTWYLNNAFYVGGDTSQVTLTINAGTQVRGSGNDHIVVWPGSAMQADGTKASPIHFLSDDAGVEGSAEWGGLFLRGYNGLPNLTGTQGENRLDYVVVAEGGAPVSVEIDGTTANYQDNLVLNGVDSSTRLSFVQSHNSARDGLQIRNGDPRLSWILATGAQRDGLWYRDFTGLVKDLMVIHNRDADGSSGRAGIYASETVAGNSNPRLVNVTLVGRDNSSVAGAADANEFGILFADNTDQVRMANVLITNFRNGCFEADSAADLSGIDVSVPGPTYIDGVHCANEAGPNGQFGMVRQGSVGFPEGVIASNNSINGDGIVYYNGAVNGVTFTGEIADRSNNFTSSWYLNNIGGIANGLVADSTSLNAFLDGDTNADNVVDASDTRSPFFMSDTEFNQDVAGNTGGYDLTHIGAVRSGSTEHTQFDGWTVATGSDEGFVVGINPALVGASSCPADVGGAQVTPLDKNAGRDRCQISGTVSSDAELTSNIDWELEGGLQVGNASTFATLGIQAGTRIFGDNQDQVDHLVVWPGSALNAQGTSARPIRFTSDDSEISGSGEWGGLYLRGYNGLTGLSGEQGASTLDYVVVAEGGAPVAVTIDGATNTYQDNLVLNGVDKTTRLTFVQSHDSARDGVHIVNGDPRLSWILVTGAERDGVWYRDFSGLIKDLMVIHNRDTDGSTGRAGIYASETLTGNSNPRLVNVSLIGRDSQSTGGDSSVNEFGILFADNTDQVRMANVLIANFRNGCFEADSAADLSAIDTSLPGPTYIDGVHCANEAGPNGNFGVVRTGSTGFPAGVIAANNSNGDGIVYYNGAGGALSSANTAFADNAGGIQFTGEIAERRNHFTSGWYLNNIRGLSNGLAADSNALNGFLDGDTNTDGTVDSDDTRSPFFMTESDFNADVAEDTGGYDLTHIGAVRGGAISNRQFDGWTVSTHRTGSFTVKPAQ
jgi:hypothetical protein